MGNLAPSRFVDDDTFPEGIHQPSFREVDVSGFGLKHFIGINATHSPDAHTERVDARFSKLEGYLFEHGVSPLHVERCGETVLAIRVDDDDIHEIVNSVLALLNRELHA